MSIERGHAASTSSTAHAAHRPAAAGKAAPPGDFLALMAALEDGPLGLALDGAALLAGDGALPNPRDGKDARELPEVLDPTALLPDRLAAETAAALAGLAMQPGPTPAPPSGPVPAGAVVADVAAAAKALVAAGAAGAADADTPQPSAPAPTAAPQAAQGAPITPGTQAAQAAQATAGMTPVAATPAAAAEFASVFEQLKNHLAAQEAAGPKPVAPGTAQPLAAAAALATGREPLRTERGAMASPASWARAEAQAVQLQLQAVAEAAGAAHTGGQGAGTASGQPGAGLADPAWAMPDFTPTVHYDATLAAVDAAPVDGGGMDAQMVEQLRYWVGQGIRSAELTVPGDADPVKVHIALSGNEAQIEFRSEHAGTREMLAGAVEQLRASLQAQGMVLSGVSVGAHDTGGRQPSGHEAGAEGRPGGGRRGGAPAAVAEVAAPAVPRRPAGALDLYV